MSLRLMSRYEIFDRSRLVVKPLAQRTHDLQLDHWLPLHAAAPPFEHAELPALAARIAHARASGAARILIMGAHVLRAGVNRHLLDLVERGFIDHDAKQRTGAIQQY